MKGAKTGGRQPGSLNRNTTEVKEALLRLLDRNIDQLSDDIQGMSPKERATLLLNLAKHVTPPALNPEQLSETQLIQVLEYLKKQKDEQK